MSLADELHKLQQLQESGAISPEEFAQAKARLLGEPAPAGAAHSPVAIVDDAALERQARQWATFLHLSQFAGYFVPLAGLILPIVLWQLKKDQLPGIDAHGRNVVNWIISEIIYAAGCAILIFFFIGIPMLVALGVLGVVFTIIGAIKANEGEIWRYPLSIRFFN
jgi:uncharacterized protein